MGRQKDSNPLKKRPRHDEACDVETEFLGRRAAQPNFRAELALAEEVVFDPPEQDEEEDTKYEGNVLSKKRRQPRKSRSRKSKPKKSVSFAPDPELVITIEPCQVELVQKSDDDDDDDATTIVFHAKQPCQQVVGVFLTDLMISCDVEVNRDMYSGHDGNGPFLVNCCLGARDLWKRCHTVRHDTVTLKALSEMLRAKMISLAVSCDSVNTRLAIFLSPAAFDFCHPRTLPTGRNPRAKRHQAASYIHILLAAIYPGSPLDETAPGKSKHYEPISAKHIYSLIDNVQIVRYMESKQPSEPLKIAGLLPQLRAYQEAAVMWMLQREKCPSESNEWKLAWFVLQKNGCHLLSNVNENETFLCLFCPYMGWLAQTVEDARMMTVGSESMSCRGGCLAEFMGLGKTVEVLALILGNRLDRSEPASVTTEGNTRTLGEVVACRRKLDFDSNDDEESIKVRQSSTDGNGSSHSQLGCSVSKHSGQQSGVRMVEMSDSTRCVQTVMTGKIAANTFANVVSPEKSDSEVVWVEDDCLGSCICGSLIHVSDGGCSTEVIIVCESCSETMHLKCSGVGMVNDKSNDFHRRVYRSSSSPHSLHSMVCSDDFCPSCIASTSRNVRSRATLIVTPSSILGQWEREIKRHTGGDSTLKVKVYDGVNNICKQSSRKQSSSDSILLLHPRYLADADIVLTTFDALMSDLSHSNENRFVAAGDDENQSGRLRKRKRYRVVASPLTSVDWWRVCLDEAQRVETPTAATSRMALKLSAQYRWCITGTPIGKGKFEDLFGLLVFLRITPFCEKEWFQHCFNVVTRVRDEQVKLLCESAVWRSTKSLSFVRDQMGVPGQTEKKVMLKFSSIEKHFYDLQLEKTLDAASTYMESLRRNTSRTETQTKILAAHIRRLRAACCHPQVGSSGLEKPNSIAGNYKGIGEKSNSIRVSSGVMTMSQILDRFIENAKLKCEESLRVAVLHTNGMGAVSRLKIEAKERGVNIKETSETCLEASLKYYTEALRLMEENGVPEVIVTEVKLHGSTDFCTSHDIMRSGVFSCDWKGPNLSDKVSFVQADFQGPSRRVSRLRVHSTSAIPGNIRRTLNDDTNYSILTPKDCVLQVSSSVLAGEFFDVTTFVIPPPISEVEEEQWIEVKGFRVSNSKSWRILVKSYHESTRKEDSKSCCYAGIVVEFYQPSIATDPLQRLHCLHNACLSASMLDALVGTQQNSDSPRNSSLRNEVATIEKQYLDAARGIHNQCLERLDAAIKTRKDIETRLKACKRANRDAALLRDCWDEGWWDDFLVLFLTQASEDQRQVLYMRLMQDLESVLHENGQFTSGGGSSTMFPMFRSLQGMRTSLQLRISSIRNGLGKAPNRRRPVPLDDMDERETKRFRCPPAGHEHCITRICSLKDNPSQSEVFENSHCQVCKADWYQTGPKCQHCKLGEFLEELNPDKTTVLVLKAIYAALRSSIHEFQEIRKLRLDERAKLFFELLESENKERSLAWKVWKAHSDLLNDIDELEQCKSSMRLAGEHEDLTKIPSEQLNAIVTPIDVYARFHDHAAKQAMALGDLRRGIDTLRFLKSQQTDVGQNGENRDEGLCAICLSTFHNDRAVLKCGHSFHFSPCLEGLRGRSTHGKISCPMRCRTVTLSSEVMIASSEQKNDGSKARRLVKGSWGTKVTRLISDVLDIVDRGEKCIIFSQWDDMLDIVQEALICNHIAFVRPKYRHDMDKCLKLFRTHDSNVLVMHVKFGGEGLTVNEATHVLMVEPLLNFSLDSQAINRIHRIGQHRKTFVWRYLVDDTIEPKIDKLRVRHDGEAECNRRIQISAGGVDGGFHSTTELMDMLSPDSIKT